MQTQEYIAWILITDDFSPLLLCICKSMREAEKQICNMSKFEDIFIQV